MATGHDAAGVSDGCTGFGWAEWIWPVYDCCADHDFGGTDGVLLDCLSSAGVPVTLAALGIAIMAFWRPLYELWLRIKRTRGK